MNENSQEIIDINYNSWVHIDMQIEESNREKFINTFINTCKSSNNINQLLELEKELKLYDTQIIQTCYVNGFRVSAINNNLIICQYIYHI